MLLGIDPQSLNYSLGCKPLVLHLAYVIYVTKSF